MKAEHLDEQEIEKVIDSYCQPNHQDIGRIAVETPPIYFSSPERALLEPFGWDDQGTYLEGEV